MMTRVPDHDVVPATHAITAPRPPDHTNEVDAALHIQRLTVDASASGFIQGDCGNARLLTCGVHILLMCSPHGLASFHLCRGKSPLAPPSRGNLLAVTDPLAGARARMCVCVCVCACIYVRVRVEFVSAV